LRPSASQDTSGSASNIRSGKTALCPAHLSGKIAAANFLMRLVPDANQVEPYLLWLYLNSPAARAFVRHIAGSSTYPNIKWSAFKAFVVPLPGIAAQRQIAADLARRLGEAEHLAACIREELAVIQTLPAALLRAAFGGPT